MEDLLGYRGQKIVVTGAASGMGAATAELLLALGAEVHALDIAPVSLPVHQFIQTDLKDQASIEAGLAKLPEQIFGLFNCAGVPSPPFSAFDTVMINFTGMRYLTEGLIPRIAAGGGIAAIASTAGLAWKSNLLRLREFLAMTDFAAQAEWLRGEPELGSDCYSFSKQAMILYCMERAGALAAAEIRASAHRHRVYRRPGAVHRRAWRLRFVQARAWALCQPQRYGASDGAAEQPACGVCQRRVPASGFWLYRRGADGTAG